MSTQRKTMLLLTVDTEASMAGLRPLPAESMVYGRFGTSLYGIERIMACCEEHGVKATFFVSTLEALHYGDGHVRQMADTALSRGHDVQLHVHPVWRPEAEGRKALTDLDYREQAETIALAADIFRRCCAAPLVAHRAGGLWLNADTVRALEAAGIPIDASVAVGYHAYPLGDGVGAPNVPRRLGSLVEVPVTTFAQMRVGGWELPRNFDINADSNGEMRFVVDRAVAEGVTAVSLLMHSFSFVGRNAESTDFWPSPSELIKFERFLDHVSGRDDVEVVTFQQLAQRLETQPELLDGPDFRPTAGVLRTYGRSWERFHTGWKSKAFALGLPVAAAGLAAGLIAGLYRLLCQ